MSSIIVRGAMGLSPGQVMRKLDMQQVAEAEWVAIEKSNGYRVLKARYGKAGHADEIPEYAGTPEIVSLR